MAREKDNDTGKEGAIEVSKDVIAEAREIGEEEDSRIAGMGGADGSMFFRHPVSVLERSRDNRAALVAEVERLRLALAKAEDQALGWQQKYEHLDNYISACLV